jgi:hypothetical protein
MLAELPPLSTEQSCSPQGDYSYFMSGAGEGGCTFAACGSSGYNVIDEEYPSRMERSLQGKRPLEVVVALLAVEIGL